MGKLKDKKINIKLEELFFNELDNFNIKDDLKKSLIKKEN